MSSAPTLASALAVMTAWLDGAERSGAVRRICDARGFGGDSVAP